MKAKFKKKIKCAICGVDTDTYLLQKVNGRLNWVCAWHLKKGSQNDSVGEG